jgi:hypothetical protein
LFLPSSLASFLEQQAILELHCKKYNTKSSPSYHAAIHAATSDERMSNNAQQTVAVVKDYYFQQTPKKEKPICVQFLFTDS